MNRIKICYSISFVLFVSLLCGIPSMSALGQLNTRIFHDTTQRKHDVNVKYLGRDLWFCIPQNLQGSGKGQFYHVYVASDKNTTVNFQVQGQPAIKKPLTKNKVVDFTAYPPPQTGDFNIGVFLGTSGQVESEKAIHVWSRDADISVYLLARAPFSTDGMYVVPVTGWGTEYVVASYTGVDDFAFSGPDEWPSEFTIVSNQDNNTVTVTPAWDIRQNGQPKVTAHPKGQPFQVTLNKGDCVQFQTIVDQNDQNYDLTGTYIKSLKPVGVIGASAGPYIPAPWVNAYPRSPEASCCGDLVLDMMQPVRTWSNSYFSVPFANRPFSGDLFLVVGTKPGQVIMRNGAQAATLGTNGIPPWNFQFLMDIHEASLWTSTDPFMLVQYMEGDWWDELGLERPQPPAKQAGDPCDVVINANKQFSKKIVFQTPVIPPAQGEADFQNFVNLIVQHNHVAKTTFDNVPISTPLLIPSISKATTFANIGGSGWDGIQLTYKRGFGEGPHIVLSDTGVGVYIYGQSNDESYAWSGALGINSVNDPDTIPPVAIASGPCFCAHVAIYDPLPGSKLRSIDQDSVDNMTFVLDTTFQPGNDSSYYDMCVIDSTKAAYLSVIVDDIAGNETTVTSVYKPANITITPVNFGTVNVGNTAFKYDTICNTGTAAFYFDQKNINFISTQTKTNPAYGFTIDSIGKNDSLYPGACRVVRIKVTTQLAPTVSDTVVLTDACLQVMARSTVNGGQPDFDIGNYTFDCTGLNANRKSINYFITNPSGSDAIVDSVWLDPNPNFKFDPADPGNTLPITVPNSNTLSGEAKITVTYNPQKTGLDTTIIHVRAILLGGKHVEKTDTIFGRACAPMELRDSASTITTCLNAQLLTFTVYNTGNLYDSITSISANPGDPGFANVLIKDSLGNTLKTPFRLGVDSFFTITVQYVPPAITSGCFTDSIIVVGKNGPIEPAPYFTVCVKNIARDVTRNVDFGTLQFGSSKVSDHMQVCNTGGDILNINSVTPKPGSDPSITLSGQYKIGNQIVTIPTKLNPGECLDIFVDFDPALNSNPYRLDTFFVSTNACLGDTLTTAAATLGIASHNLQGYPVPLVFSCAQHLDSVHYNNGVDGSITGLTINGPDAVNFASAVAVPIPVKGGVQSDIPIRFLPSTQNAARTYNAKVVVEFTSTKNVKNYDSTAISANSQGMNLLVASKFANVAQHPGDKPSLPIVLTLNTNGLTAAANDARIDLLGLNRIELTYTFDMNILDIVNSDLKTAVTFQKNSPWSVDMTTSKIGPPSNTLYLTLVKTGAVINDNDLNTPIAFINFQAAVSDKDTTTGVTLANWVLKDTLNNALNTVTGCLKVDKQDSNFILLYECGDLSLHDFMITGKNPIAAGAVAPNPAGGAHGNIISFKYAARDAGRITLVIYDELGKEVARVIDNQQMPAGAYEARFDASALSAGSYTARYSLDNKSAASGRFVIQR